MDVNLLSLYRKSLLTLAGDGMISPGLIGRIEALHFYLLTNAGELSDPSYCGDEILWIKDGASLTRYGHLSKNPEGAG